MTRMIGVMLTVAFAVGLGVGILGHRYWSLGKNNSVVDAISPVDGSLTPTRQGTTSAYTDDEVQRMEKQWKARESDGETLLGVVPNGTSAPLLTVLGALGIDKARLGEPKTGGANFVIGLTWQLSPSFDLYCMTALNDPLNDGLEYLDPRRRVYGVRIIDRAKRDSQQ